mmetsp:Transcript_1529/g.3896  ORF Transcript_1529/g.3896 Transcript_1529/m.3896 type:complete len:359 (+) Transcript_1529:125-1201(+)
MVAISNNDAPALSYTSPLPPPASSTGFSFSPGGLLFPYHLGVITSLEHHGRLSDQVHLAGASAGAIAVASHAARTPPAIALEATFRMCDACETQFGGRAVGKLLPLLKIEMDRVLSPDAHTIINEREGVVALAHRELFPNNRPVLTTDFETRDDLIEAVCDSSMFPFFSTPFPVRLRYKEGERIPRVIVDGFFTVPRERYGCPDFAHLNVDRRVEKNLRSMGGVLVDEPKNGDNEQKEQRTDDNDDDCDDAAPVIERTITVACFPHETVGLTASLKHDQISPEPDYDDSIGQMRRLIRYATQPSPRKDLEGLYEQGWADAEKWSYEEELREKELEKRWLKEKRHEAEVEEAILRGELF